MKRTTLAFSSLITLITVQAFAGSLSYRVEDFKYTKCEQAGLPLGRYYNSAIGVEFMTDNRDGTLNGKLSHKAALLAQSSGCAAAVDSENIDICQVFMDKSPFYSSASVMKFKLHENSDVRDWGKELGTISYAIQEKVVDGKMTTVLSKAQFKNTIGEIVEFDRCGLIPRGGEPGGSD